MAKIPAASRARVVKLRQTIEEYRYAYHVLDTSTISEAALDSLKAELATLEGQYPELITPDSPTQRVGGQSLPQFKQITHRVRMLSLNDAFTIEDLQPWENRNQKIIKQTDHYFSGHYFVQLKIDGVAVALIYQDSQFVQAATRGDGSVGEDVTHTVRTIESIPLRLRHHVPGRVEVRGEVYMLKADLAKLNKTRQAAGQPAFVNPRNVAAGSIRQLDPAVAAARPLRFIAWELTEGIAVETRQAEEEQLKKCGFAVPPDSRFCRTLQEVSQYIEPQSEKRRRYPFLVDGLVLKVNNLSRYRRLGVVGKAPRGAIAFKFSAEEATTVVENISIQVGRTGALTPVAHLKPVLVAGTTVARATLHNAAEITRKDVRVGDTVIIRKAGDIIPEVVRVLPKLRPAKTKPFHWPKRCPRCQAALHQENGGVIWRCSNPNCFPQQAARMLHAVSRLGFDIEGLGDRIVEQLLQAGLVTDPPDLWQLTADTLKSLPGFADISAQKLIKAIQNRKRLPLWRFIMALGIPHVGLVTAQDLARHFKTMGKLRQAADRQVAEEQLMSVNGIGQKTAQAIVAFLRQPDTQHIIKKYKKFGIKIMAEHRSGPLSGKTFVFTGNLGQLTRAQAKQQVIALGGQVAGTVSKNSDYVVVGDEPGSKLAKAQQLGITTLSPAQFSDLITSSQ